MKTIVIAIARVRPPYRDDIEHYQKLLSRYTDLDLIETRDEESALKRIPGRAYVCMLSADGHSLTSVAFSRFIEERRLSGVDLCFIVGGPKGLTKPAGNEIDRTLSFGPMTLPHQLAQVVLFEQLYRGFKIIAGEPYHY